MRVPAISFVVVAVATSMTAAAGFPPPTAEPTPAIGPTVAAASQLEAVRGEPRMPDGFVARWTDSSGLTWRETGSMPLSFDDASEALKASMKEQGYFLRHDIFDKSLPDQRLFLFVKDGKEVTAMLWRIDAENTGLGWGVTKKKEAIQ